MNKDRFQTYSIVCAGLFICALMVCYGFFFRDPIIVYSVDEAANISGLTVIQKKIDINTASFDDLVQIKGIGKVTAQRIIAYRTKFHGFRFIEELQEVEGIGTKKYEDIQSYLFVGE